MSEDEATPIKRTRLKYTSFSENLGDLSPLQEFRGPKVPNNRQVLRFFIFLISVGFTQRQAADEVVEKVLQKHETDISKSPRRLSDAVLSLHKQAK